MRNSKVSTARLKKSSFFMEVEAVAKAWDYYLETGDKEKAQQMMYEWLMAKLALEHITGKVYGFSRKGDGNYSVVNEKDRDDILFCGFNDYGRGA